LRRTALVPPPSQARTSRGRRSCDPSTRYEGRPQVVTSVSCNECPAGRTRTCTESPQRSAPPTGGGLLQIAPFDRLIAADDVGAFAGPFFVGSVLGFDVLGEAKLIELFVVLHPLVHRRIGPLSADEHRLNHAPDRLAGLGVLGQRRLGDGLNDLKLLPSLSVRQNNLIHVR